MTKYFALALAAIVLSPGGGHAADCLTRIDSMVVAYDLPAGPITGQTAGEQMAPEKLPKLPAGDVGLPRTTPPGRPGMAQLVAPGPVQPALPEHNALSASQRNRLIELLQRARTAEAMGDETACSGFLEQAQSVVAPHG